MIRRSHDVEDILQATAGYENELKNFNPHVWATDENCVVLVKDKDVALFGRMLPHVVIGHYFFKSRGKDAVETAKEMLKEIFTGPYEVEVIEGLSPLQKLGARWMNRKLGFKSYGVTDTIAGPCEIVMLTKDEWRTINE